MTKVATKFKLMSSQAAISADTTETTLGSSGWFDFRSAEDLVFDFLSTLNTGFSTGSAFFTGEIWGKDTEGGTARLILTTAELVVDVAQQIPSAANAPGTVLPRYLQVRWNETGTMTSFTATCTARFNRPRGPGKQANNAPLS